MTATPLLPPLALAGYLVCIVGTGVLANCAVLAALLRRGMSGLHTIVLQLAMADALLLGGVAGLETWSRNERTWSFGTGGCVVYLGLEVFAGTASLYFVAALALHSLATANLEERAADRRQKRSGEEDEEMRSSRHSLVANSDSSTPPRTMSINYRIADTTVPVLLPAAFVWALAASLSVPEFALATTVRLESGAELCTFVDPSHRLNMHSMLAAFDLFVPAFILTTAGALAVVKIRSRRKRNKGSVNEVDDALKLTVWLVCTYALLCVPRSALVAYHAYCAEGEGTAASFRNPVLSEGAPAGLGLALSCINFAAALARPLLCTLLLPRVRSALGLPAPAPPPAAPHTV